MTTEKTFPVVEVFGPTLQGEGRDIGTPCHFVRFGGCDYRCGQLPDGTWRTDGWVCDSLYAVLPDQVRVNASKMTADDIVTSLRGLPGDVGWVIYSGGNPALHELGELTSKLHAAHYKVAVETQGSIWKSWLRETDLVTVSPKPPSAHQGFTLSGYWAFLDRLRDTPHIVKVVIWDESDLEFASELVPSTNAPFYLSVCNDWQHPDSQSDLLSRMRWIQETVVERYPQLQRAVVLPQLHVLLWGNARGR